MYLRCKTCHGAIWIDRPATGDTLETSCRRCDQRYSLDGRLGALGEELDVAARRLAKDHETDLPAAYSVLLGLITLDELLETIRPAPPAGQPAAGESSPASSHRYDRAFADAVEEGHLSVRQAKERGSRTKFARRLVERHGFTMETALAVTDNRITLLGAIRQRKASGVIAIRRSGRPSRRLTPLIVALFLVAGLAIIALRTFRSESATTDLATTATVKRNSQSEIVSVSGPDPLDVLHAYCEALRQSGKACESLDLMPASTGEPSLRVGILVGSDEALLAILIRRDDREGTWATGNGSSPLRPLAAPEAARAIYRKLWVAN